jgi:hypothetical protein
MMKFLIILFFSMQVYGAGNLVLNGNVYTLKQKDKKNCGVLGSPEYLGHRATIRIAFDTFLLTAESMCHANPPELCDKIKQVEFALNGLFTVIREFPSKYRSQACDELRKFCIEKCEQVKLLPIEDCLIQCNQYETYNK